MNRKKVMYVDWPKRTLYESISTCSVEPYEMEWTLGGWGSLDTSSTQSKKGLPLPLTYQKVVGECCAIPIKYCRSRFPSWHTAGVIKQAYDVTFAVLGSMTWSVEPRAVKNFETSSWEKKLEPVANTDWETFFEPWQRNMIVETNINNMINLDLTWIAGDLVELVQQRHGHWSTCCTEVLRWLF